MSGIEDIKTETEDARLNNFNNPIDQWKAVQSRIAQSQAARAKAQSSALDARRNQIVYNPYTGNIVQSLFDNGMLLVDVLSAACAKTRLRRDKAAHEDKDTEKSG